MLSKSRITFITSLKQKKYRLEHKLFVVEGIKTINEFLNSSYVLDHLYTINEFDNVSNSFQTLVTDKELKKISFLKNTNSALAIFKIKKQRNINNTGLLVGLDDVRDPGNLGTIIRLCDWFGVTELICSSNTVDCYNPKVVQATMGSLTRVNVSYFELEDYLLSVDFPVYGTFMEGESIYNLASTSVDGKGIVIFGNEANGISEKIERQITHRVTIPKFGEIQKTESLNVAMATSIVLSEFKRKITEL